MNSKIILLLFIFNFIVNVSPLLNSRPIIGILSEEFSDDSWAPGKSFIMTSYVRFVEASGARVVPILIYKSKEYYQDILNKVNGLHDDCTLGHFQSTTYAWFKNFSVLLPGGGDLLNSAGYGRAGKIIYQLAVEMNDKGDYFPVWGTCLGFEMLNLAAAKKNWMTKCAADDAALNINFTEGFANSKMFSNLPPELKDKMETENITIHLHHWCITPQNFTLSGLDKYFKVLALNRDSKNVTFVSIIEAFKYPFYGVSFHPEKVVYDWSPYSIPIPHSAEAVETSHFFGNFFINEARKNFHKFPSKSEEDRALIYNFDAQRDETGTDISAQMYIFK